MQILASSVQPVSDFFMHAGYTSAWVPPPRSLTPETIKEIFTGYEPVLKLDMAEALRLKGEAIRQGVQEIGNPIFNHIHVLIGSERLAVVLGVMIFIGGLALIYRARGFAPPRKSALSLSVLFLILIGFAAFAGGFDSLNQQLAPLKPPWEGITPRAYEHPEAATKAILYGIIADANFDISRRINTLADLKDEIGLPSRNLTEGQRYALATYGLDGWGHPFRLEKLPSQCVMARTNDVPVTVSTELRSEYEDKGYTLKDSIPAHDSIRSAGADGILNTADDINACLLPTSYRKHWDLNRWGYFIQHTGEEHYLFVHRAMGLEYRAAHGWRASRLTGSLLFDVEQFPHDILESIDDAQGSHSQSPALWLVVFKQPNGVKKDRKHDELQ